MEFPKQMKPHVAVKTKVVQSHQKRKHLNKKFYTSTKWRKFRKSYVNAIQLKQMDMATQSKIPDQQKLEILSCIPVCEHCLDRYLKGFQPGLNQGRELDHIIRVNPENALNPADQWGKPLDVENVQLLCNRCHSEKSARENIK